MNHWSQLVKGMTTVANWFRVVTPYPLGTQSGPLAFPYGCLMVAYGSLMVRLWLRKRRPAKGRFSLIFNDFKLIFIDFQWFSMVFMIFNCF